MSSGSRDTVVLLRLLSFEWGAEGTGRRLNASTVRPWLGSDRRSGGVTMRTPRRGAGTSGQVRPDRLQRVLAILTDGKSAVERPCTGEVLGDRVHLAVGVLADLGQHIERLLRGELEPLHQDALGLP